MNLSISECKNLLLAERNRLIECREKIETLEKREARTEPVQELARLKDHELQMVRKIGLMDQTVSRITESNADIFEIVNENPRLWSGTILM